MVLDRQTAGAALACARRTRLVACGSTPWALVRTVHGLDRVVSGSYVCCPVPGLDIFSRVPWGLNPCPTLGHPCGDE
jgi:hypothetical protein